MAAQQGRFRSEKPDFSQDVVGLWDRHTVNCFHGNGSPLPPLLARAGGKGDGAAAVTRGMFHSVKEHSRQRRALQNASLGLSRAQRGARSNKKRDFLTGFGGGAR